LNNEIVDDQKQYKLLARRFLFLLKLTIKS